MAERHDTSRLAGFIRGVSWQELPEPVQHAARRHLIDTVGVIIRGAETDLARRVGALLLAESQGRVPLPGTELTASRFDADYIAGVGGHELELDDGYRAGSVHPGVAVVPALMAASYGAGVGGARFMSALVAGYECVAAVSRAVHPHLRRRGFYPTGTVGALGAAAAVARLQRLDDDAIGRALGIAASVASGLFAFVGGGGDVKRLHAGHAAREGLVADLLAEIGTGGPPAILEGRDGFNQAFAGEARPLLLPPTMPLDSKIATSSLIPAAATCNRRWKRWPNCERRTASCPVTFAPFASKPMTLPPNMPIRAGRISPRRSSASPISWRWASISGT